MMHNANGNDASNGNMMAVKCESIYYSRGAIKSLSYKLWFSSYDDLIIMFMLDTVTCQLKVQTINYSTISWITIID